MPGYVKSYRDAQHHRVFDDPILWKIFSWCVWNASYEPGTFGDMDVPVGSFVTGRIAAAKELKMPESVVYRGMQKLASQKYGCISLKSNNKFTLVTVCNYTTYQGSDSPSAQRKNNKRTTNAQRENTVKEGKEIKEGEEITPLPPEFDCDEFRKAWGEWVQHRKEIREPLTPLAIKKQFNKFSSWGLKRSLAAIEVSILKQWKGIWEASEVLPTSNDTTSSPDAAKRNLEALNATYQKMFGDDGNDNQ